MRELAKYMVVGAGGFLGANARYIVGGWAQQKLGPGFPYGTLIINVSGSFILGAFATLALHFPWDDQWRLLIAIGFVGAYTTFSTFEYETLSMLTDGTRVRAAIANIVLSLLAGLAAAYLGVIVARLLLRGRA